MSSTQTAPTAEEILAGLAADPRFADPDAVAMVKDYVTLLPDVCGEDRLGQLFGLELYLRVECDFLKRLLETDFGTDFDDLGLTRNLYGTLADMLNDMADDIDAVLAQQGQTEQEAMVSDELGLNEELRALYQAGTLTMVDVIRLQPGVFFPKPT